MSADARWAVALICCDHSDGMQVFESWHQADDFRNQYQETDDHVRVGIVSRVPADTRVGYHSDALVRDEAFLQAWRRDAGARLPAVAPCSGCGHEHSGEQFGFICVGCPCEQIIEGLS